MMSQSLIRIRAEDDAADLVLKQSTIPALQCATTSAALTSTAPTSSASSAMDSMWSEYEQYLQAARAAQEAGIDIFPQAAFVVKVSLLSDTQKGRATKVRKDLLEEDERGDSESDKLFINVCTDACVDAPEIVRQPADVPALPPSVTSATPTSSAAAPPPGSLRLPMSVGPLNPCKSRSGAPSLSVDVVIHPSTLIQPLDAAHSQAAYQYAIAQAALIQRQSGTAPPVLTPAQQQAMAMREVKRTVAAFALQRIEEKYKLRVDEQAELKFPKAAYRGSLPPAAQRIRRNKDNPLHAMTPQQREEVGKRGKVLVQEVTLPPQNKPAASTAAATTIPSEATTAPGKETILSSSVKQPSESGNASAQADSHGKQRVERQERVTEGSGQTKQEVRAEQSTNMAEQNTTGQKPASVTPAYTLDTEGGQLTLQVQLPGVSSSAEVDATVTSTDVRITTQAAADRPAYQLHVVLPEAVDDERVQAKFNKKKCFITLTMPVLSQPHAAVSDACSNDASAAAVAVTEATVDQLSISDKSAAVVSGTVDPEERLPIAAGTESGAMNACSAVAAVDWAARLGLSNRLIDQSCLSYN